MPGATWTPDMEAHLLTYIIILSPHHHVLSKPASVIARSMSKRFPTRTITKNSIAGKHRRYPWPGSRLKIFPADLETIRTMRLAGVSYESIARHLHVTRNAIIKRHHHHKG